MHLISYFIFHLLQLITYDPDGRGDRVPDIRERAHGDTHAHGEAAPGTDMQQVRAAVDLEERQLVGQLQKWNGGTHLEIMFKQHTRQTTPHILTIQKKT